jgi:hypothetical protein
LAPTPRSMRVDAMSEHILVERHGAVQAIRMNRPDKKNAITRAMYAAMAQALAEGDSDAEIRCHVILGVPGAFSSGNDIADFMAATGGADLGKEVIDFLLALARNPCGCGNHGSRFRVCECPPHSIRRYQQRISGPVRDRIDIYQQVEPPSVTEIDAGLGRAEASSVVAERVADARERQEKRLADSPWRVNSEVPVGYLRREFPVPADVTAPAFEQLRRGVVTARGVDRILRLAWTVADLAGHDRPTRADVLDAVALRLGDAS